MYAYWQLRTEVKIVQFLRSSLLIACEFYNLICYRRVWQLEMHLLNFCNRHCDLLGLCHIINCVIKNTDHNVTHTLVLFVQISRECVTPF